ncbi:hypothetical protein AAFF_G00267250 [Aldrovandia affinis]|uniref:Uncharacterized protein n=1 Tax=Aldrovandia affinis TaxID=143900 RepID=A0AAD7W2H0_9TELE|nr:hypothetical protein AAFF_G00267250 [Aldrovandia affinis]
MSSPLSMLGKNKRVPLPGGQKQGRRGVPFKETPRAGHEAALMGDIIAPGLRLRGAAEAPSMSRSKVAQRNSSITAPGLSDFELMTTTLEKLGQLERKVNTQTQDIQSKKLPQELSHWSPTPSYRVLEQKC